MANAHAVLLSLLTSFGGLSAIGWVLKTYIDRKLQHSDKLRDRQLELEAKTKEKYVEHIHNVRLKAVPEIHEIAYRLRNQCRGKFETWGRDEVDRSMELWAQYADCLFRYRIFLPEDCFFVLHRYKATVQQLLLHLSSEVERSSLSSPRRDRSASDLTAMYVEQVNERFAAVGSCLTGLLRVGKGEIQ